MGRLTLFGGLAVRYLNMGLMMGLTFGALILLWPVTNRLLAALLFLFSHCGDWRTGRQDLHVQTDRPEEWSACLDSPLLLEDLPEKPDRPGLNIQEMWPRVKDQLVVLDGGGQWYFCTYWWGGTQYRLQNALQMDQAFLDDCQRMA